MSEYSVALTDRQADVLRVMAIRAGRARISLYSIGLGLRLIEPAPLDVERAESKLPPADRVGLRSHDRRNDHRITKLVRPVARRLIKRGMIQLYSDNLVTLAEVYLLPRGEDAIGLHDALRGFQTESARSLGLSRWTHGMPLEPLGGELRERVIESLLARLRVD